MSKQLKILYAAGPGNVIETFNYWRQGQDDPSQVSMTFSGQFYDVCTALDAEGHIIASQPQKQILKQGQFTLEHRPIPFNHRSGILYYLGQIYYELGIVLTALKSRCDVVVGAGRPCFFVLSLLPRFGVQVVPSLHCVLWAKYKPLSKAQKIVIQLNRRFFTKDCFAILSTSEDINQQVQELTDHHPTRIINFLSTYRRHAFEGIAPSNPEQNIFHVLFAGRVEANKGVFDLLEIAKRFQKENHNTIVFHICGTGTALEDLQHQVETAHLQSTFVLHGYCNKAQMRQMFSLSHLVIVPTTSDFIEGLNQVVIEGVLANRPVVTSSICPALNYVKEAVVEVPPDDVQAYGDAILKLQQNYALYEEKRQKCQGLQEQFYCASRSWGTALKTILHSVQVPQEEG